MIQKPMDILTQYPVRRTTEQKSHFRDAVCQYAEKQGLNVQVEESKKDCHNIVIGQLQGAKCMITAHYDTPAGIGIPNFMIPCNFLLFILYQLLIVGLFIGLAFLLGGVIWLATRNLELAFLTGYIGYFAAFCLMRFGPANPNNVNDNSSGLITLLEIAQALPEEIRQQVCFVLFDKEESGLVGSKAFRKQHKNETENLLMLNLDCVGDGDHILLFPGKRLRKQQDLMEKLLSIQTDAGNKQLRVWDKSSHFNSDQKNYPLGVGIAAMHKRKFVGFCCGRIHTKRDTILEEENVNILRDQLLKFLAG